MLHNKICFVVNNKMYKVQPQVYKKTNLWMFHNNFAEDISVQSVLLEDAGYNCEFEKY